MNYQVKLDGFKLRFMSIPRITVLVSTIVFTATVTEIYDMRLHHDPNLKYAKTAFQIVRYRVLDL